MTEIWFGAMPFGSQVDETLARKMVHRCLDAGITRFDTADAYNWGASEEMLGKCIAGIDGLTISTKVGAQYGAAKPESGLFPDWIRSSIDGSLGRLGLETLDTYYLHQPDYRVPIEETMPVFRELLDAGTIRQVGVSNFAAWQVMEIIGCGITPTIAQQMWNVITRDLEGEWVPFAQKYGITTLAYNQLAGGLLTGKHTIDSDATGTRFDGNAMYRNRFWQAGYFQAVEKLKQVADEAGLTLLELSLRWIRDRADGLLIGATTMEQLEENLAALEGDLSPDVVDACDAVWSELRGPIPKYNR
jgi:aryl-alcohol dehydrogenase-like predicted oxidoreductase